MLVCVVSPGIYDRIRQQRRRMFRSGVEAPAGWLVAVGRRWGLWSMRDDIAPVSASKLVTRSRRLDHHSRLPSCRFLNNGRNARSAPL
jgi:hypothetical protein